MRWQLPFHILDAVLFSSSGRLTHSIPESKLARAAIKRLQNVLEEGARDRFVQTSPHLVLISTEFYHAKMKPLLADWVMTFFIQKGLKGITEEHAIAYLLHGTASKESAAEIEKNLDDEYIKLFNLGHDWLSHMLPHVLSKFNRVNYGLLTEDDLALMKEDGSVPVSRRLTSVPFVGKDVPSRAAEFAHPDIVIGLTVLSYRYD